MAMSMTIRSFLLLSLIASSYCDDVKPSHHAHKKHPKAAHHTIAAASVKTKTNLRRFPSGLFGAPGQGGDDYEEEEVRSMGDQTTEASHEEFLDDYVKDDGMREHYSRIPSVRAVTGPLYSGPGDWEESFSSPGSVPPTARAIKEARRAGSSAREAARRAHSSVRDAAGRAPSSVREAAGRAHSSAREAAARAEAGARDAASSATDGMMYDIPDRNHEHVFAMDGYGAPGVPDSDEPELVPPSVPARLRSQRPNMPMMSDLPGYGAPTEGKVQTKKSKPKAKAKVKKVKAKAKKAKKPEAPPAPTTPPKPWEGHKYVRHPIFKTFTPEKKIGDYEQINKDPLAIDKDYLTDDGPPQSATGEERPYWQVHHHARNAFDRAHQHSRNAFDRFRSHVRRPGSLFNAPDQEEEEEEDEEAIIPGGPGRTNSASKGIFGASGLFGAPPRMDADAAGAQLTLQSASEEPAAEEAAEEAPAEGGEEAAAEEAAAASPMASPAAGPMASPAAAEEEAEKEEEDEELAEADEPVPGMYRMLYENLYGAPGSKKAHSRWSWLFGGNSHGKHDDHGEGDDDHDSHGHGDHGRGHGGHGHSHGPVAKYDFDFIHDEAPGFDGKTDIHYGHHYHSMSTHGHHSHRHSAGAHSVAVGLIASVVLMPLVVFMVLTDSIVAELTMKMLDTFISIFLAVLWFNCFTQALVTFEVAKMFPYATEVFGLVQILALYAIAMAIAYMWRDEKKTLITFCSCGAHYIAFASISTAGMSQSDFSENMADGIYEPVMSFSFCGVIIAFLLGMSVVNHYVWRKDVEHEKLHECIDELELDILGLTASFAITQAVRHAITGRYPPMHFLLIQMSSQNYNTLDSQLLGEGHGHHYHHQAWQRYFMLFWAIGLACIASVVLPALSKVHGSWMLHKFTHVLKVVMIMLVAWGFLLWGQWEFYENLFTGDPMFGHMVFAVIATLVCLATLVFMGKMMGDHPTPEVRETSSITITGISLVAAWSWEHCFNLAFDIIGQEYQVGYKGLVPKLVLCVIIPAALLPTYVQHIKTRVIEDEERFLLLSHHHGEEHGRHH
eukprot:TRINITY_DN649_c0_g2_i1.p1 TRINITY_DN649_c0_g2~~TRINITY_DN649_c0_g2_i1.p1  ORF type:complete len:1064 (+),score=260.91 TRINITY_DN649_c0_g2_i1:104-3295(+)